MAAASLVGLMVMEVAVRLVAPQQLQPNPPGLYREDPILGFALSPGIDGRSSGPEWDVRVRTNSLGLRERELTAVPPAAHRLLVLGDSFTFGAGVEEEEAFPRQVELQLHQAGVSDVVVINGGVPAYGTAREAQWLGQLLDTVEPDAILLGFFLGNDFYDNLNLNEYSVVSGYLVTRETHGSRAQLGQRLGLPPALKVALRTHLHLYSLAMNGWSAILAAGGWTDSEAMFDVYRQSPGAGASPEMAATSAALENLAALCRSRNLPLGLVLIPDSRTLAAAARRQDLDAGRPAMLVLSITEPLALPVLDLTSGFAGDASLSFPIDGHWNASGHEFAGRRIAESLVVGDLHSLMPTSPASAPAAPQRDDSH